MKRFTFSLERLLRLRHQETEQAKLYFAQALRHQQEMEAQLEQMTARWQQGMEQAVSSRVVTASEFAARRHHVDYLYNQALAAAEATGQAVTATDERRQELVVQKQREQVLDKYRERRFAEYQVEMVREEQKFLDEITQRPGALNDMGRQEVES